MIETVATAYYGRTPRWLLAVIDPPLYRAYRRVRRAVRIVADLAPRTGRIVERTPGRPDEPVRVAGSGELLHLFTDRVGGAWERESGRRRSLRSLVRSRRSRPALIEADRCYRRYLARRGYVAVPEWVLFRADLSGSWDQHLERYRDRTEDNIRRVRNGGFDYRIDTDPDTLEAFYHTMYLPYVRARYGENALLASLPFLANTVRTGLFLVVTRDGEDVAALLISTAGSEPWLAFMGVRDGDFEHVRRGAVSALYLFALQWAHEAGHSGLDVGHTRPFRDDGLYRYKRRWGMHPMASPRKTRALFVRACDDPRVEAFLQAPVVTYDDAGGLAGAYTPRGPAGSRRSPASGAGVAEAVGAGSLP